MRTATTTETHQAFGMTPSAPWRVLNIKIEPGYRQQVTFMHGSTGSHESTDNIPGRDVIRGLPYAAFIVSGIDTHRHGCWVDLSQWLRSWRIDGSIFAALREEDFFSLAALLN